MLTYNIPAAMANSYTDHNLILRSKDPEELVRVASQTDQEAIVRLDVLGLQADAAPLTGIAPAIPIEIVQMGEIQELGALYAFQDLGKSHSVSINIEAVPGFHKAVKVAVSLGYGVSLEVTGPEPALIDEMKTSLEFYLHNSMVDRPVEFFHSLLIAFYDESPRTIWNIQFEDPEYDRYVTDTGELVLSSRLKDLPIARR